MGHTPDKAAQAAKQMEIEGLLAQFFDGRAPNNIEQSKRLIGSFVTLRRERQKPAHSVLKNEFDLKYTTQRREILFNAARALANILFVLLSHSSAPKITLPKWLEEGRVEVI